MKSFSDTLVSLAAAGFSGEGEKRPGGLHLFVGCLFAADFFAVALLSEPSLSDCGEELRARVYDEAGRSVLMQYS